VHRGPLHYFFRSGHVKVKELNVSTVHLKYNNK
jgi:hypothetical protein